MAATPQTMMTPAQASVDELRRIRQVLLAIDRDNELDLALHRVESRLISLLAERRRREPS